MSKQFSSEPSAETVWQLAAVSSFSMQLNNVSNIIAVASTRGFTLAGFVAFESLHPELIQFLSYRGRTKEVRTAARNCLTALESLAKKVASRLNAEADGLKQRNYRQ